MQVAGLIIGIIAIITLFFASIPLLGWINWINIPFAIIGLTFNIVGLRDGNRSRVPGIIGMFFCLLAIILGFLRLQWGCGII
jgi:hypothetical protein